VDIREYPMKISSILIAVLIFLPTATFAKVVDVRMVDTTKNGGPGFVPDLIRLTPGDSVHFVASDLGHNVQSIPGMLPVKASSFGGELNNSFTVTFDKPGLYGFKCSPHYFIGMVGLIVVGDTHNEDEIKKISHPGIAKSAFENIFHRLDEGEY